MIELGKVQELETIREKDFGAYLVEKEGDEATVLLPRRRAPEGAGIRGKVEVPIYEDSSDRLVTTTERPKLQVDETTKLKVKGVAKIGAFLDMKLEKDLLLPLKKQTHSVGKGEQCPITLYVDKSRRLAATIRAYSHISDQSFYRAEDWVTGTVYKINETIGAFMAVDHKYYGLIPKREFYGRFREGDTVQAKVVRVRKDGELDLYVREKSHVQTGTDAEKVLRVTNQFSGVPPFNGKTEPEVITREFNISKNAFKRVVGRLLKEGKIRTTDKAIECV